MTALPPLPRGVERDDTEHGKLYYTRKQMQDYGMDCIEHWSQRNRPTSQPRHNESDVVNDLMGFMKGMGK